MIERSAEDPGILEGPRHQASVYCGEMRVVQAEDELHHQRAVQNDC